MIPNTIARWSRPALALLLVVIVSVTAWLLLRPGQTGPVYHGKTLSAWSNSRNLSRDDWQKAVAAGGTNAIPTLLAMLETKDSALKLALMALTRKQRLINFRFFPAQGRHQQAIDGFAVLGDRADIAVPTLTRLYDQNISASSQRAAALILGKIGPPAKEAIPSLARGVDNTNVVVRGCTIWALARIHSQPDVVVPILVKSLSDPDSSVRVNAAMGLRDFGADAKVAVPTLIESLKDPDPTARSYAETALKAIAPETAAKQAPQ